MLSILGYCRKDLSKSLIRYFSVNSVPVIYDSISNSMRQLDMNKNDLTWYSCGPTVYDDSHIGHARNYVSIDIAQRIFKYWYGKTLFTSMGITDIDDKIIKRSKEKNIPWKQLTEQYENSFFEDMNQLNVCKPNAILKVSDHIQDIIEFIKILVDKNMAYIRPSGVYFDTNNNLIQYGKMRPSHFDSIDTETGNEIVFQRIDKNNDKKNQFDFALWKNTNEEGFMWESPWGKGRPGWHIECSAMTNYLYGDNLDIHAGGIDLKFPHHCNEIALTEAYCTDNVRTKCDWPHYMIHTGHIYIEGRKMSKSLKNFITIKDMLKEYDGNIFRFYCLSFSIQNKINFSFQNLDIYKQKYIHMSDSLNVIHTIITKCINSDNNNNNIISSWTKDDYKLRELYINTRTSITSSLYNNMDTPVALSSFLSLIEDVRIYIEQRNRRTINIQLIQDIYIYFNETLDHLGFISQQTNNISSSSSSLYSISMDELASFRKTIREIALNNININDNNIVAKNILKECDRIRDQYRKEKNVILIDGKEDLFWKPITYIDEKEEDSKQKDPAKTIDMKQKMKQRVKELEEKSKIDPEMMFIQTNLYSEYDSNGIPTKYKNGEEVKKSQRKKLIKEKEKQIKSHQHYLEKHKIL
ncbi:hypothetical protein WA158_002644 [Blastocystis sp. Blastoise]